MTGAVETTARAVLAEKCRDPRLRNVYQAFKKQDEKCPAPGALDRLEKRLASLRMLTDAAQGAINSIRAEYSGVSAVEPELPEETLFPDTEEPSE